MPSVTKIGTTPWRTPALWPAGRDQSKTKAGDKLRGLTGFIMGDKSPKNTDKKKKQTTKAAAKKKQ